MARAGNALVVEIDSWMPAETPKDLKELVGVAEVAQALLHAHVEPDAEGRARCDCLDHCRNEREGAAGIPPERGRHDGELAEDVWVLHAEVERDEATE